VSTGQAKQAERPVVSEYVPDAHAEQAEAIDVPENLPLSQGRQKE